MMSRLEQIPENPTSMMDFAGTRIQFRIGEGCQTKLCAITTAEQLANCVIGSERYDKKIRETLFWNPMDPEWKARLDEKQSGYASDIKLAALKERLLSFGGDDVCFPPDGFEEDIDSILENGQFWFGVSAKRMRGDSNRSHQNSAQLWNANKQSTRICTGYALSEDGLWRQHSWVMNLKTRSNQIVETTTKRVAYFGFCMTTEQCTEFTRWNA